MTHNDLKVIVFIVVVAFLLIYFWGDSNFGRVSFFGFFGGRTSFGDDNLERNSSAGVEGDDIGGEIRPGKSDLGEDENQGGAKNENCARTEDELRRKTRLRVMTPAEFGAFIEKDVHEKLRAKTKETAARLKNRKYPRTPCESFESMADEIAYKLFFSEHPVPIDTNPDLMQVRKSSGEVEIQKKSRYPNPTFVERMFKGFEEIFKEAVSEHKPFDPTLGFSCTCDGYPHLHSDWREYNGFYRCETCLATVHNKDYIDFKPNK